MLLYLTILAIIAGQAAAQNICSGHAHNTLVRNTQDCSTYFHCFNGQPLLTQCPSGELFDSISRRCGNRNDADCFACPDVVFIDVPVVNECSQFVRCFNNASTQMTCADGLAFDRDVRMCNVENRVTCPFEVQCPRNSDVLIFTRDRDDCGIFYICMDGHPVVRQCPDTLHFNPETNMCDLPANTECVHHNYMSKTMPKGKLNEYFALE